MNYMEISLQMKTFMGNRDEWKKLVMLCRASSPGKVWLKICIEICKAIYKLIKKD